MGGEMTRNRTRIIVASAMLGLLAACGGAALLPVDSLFGPTMQAAFLLVETDAPMASADIVGLAADRPLSLTTDPIDL